MLTTQELMLAIISEKLKDVVVHVVQGNADKTVTEYEIRDITLAMNGDGSCHLWVYPPNK